MSSPFEKPRAKRVVHEGDQFMIYIMTLSRWFVDRSFVLLLYDDPIQELRAQFTWNPQFENSLHDWLHDTQVVSQPAEYYLRYMVDIRLTISPIIAYMLTRDLVAKIRQEIKSLPIFPSDTLIAKWRGLHWGKSQKKIIDYWLLLSKGQSSDISDADLMDLRNKAENGLRSVLADVLATKMSFRDT